MVVRRSKKRAKLLGQRTRGHGDTKNRRGAGSRGGRGLAGSHKHKWSKYYGKFGKEKRKVLSSKKVRAINIDQLMQLMPRLLEKGKASKEQGMIVVDGRKVGFDKLLSNGSLKEKVLLRNMKASKKAAEKVMKAQGKIEGLEEPELEGFEESEEEALEEKGKEKEEAGEDKPEKVESGKAEERKHPARQEKRNGGKKK